MPVNGRLAAWDRLEFRVESTADVDAAGTGPLHWQHDAQLRTESVLNVQNLAPGFFLSVSSGTAGGGQWQVHYEGPHAPLGGHTLGGAGVRNNVSLSLVLHGVRLYARENTGQFRLVAESLELIANDEPWLTLPGVDELSTGCGPGYIPMVGLPPVITAGNGGSGYTGPGEYAWTLVLDQTVAGGWRFETDGAWQDLPVRLPSFETPDGDAEDIVVSTRTWGEHLNLHLEAEAERTCLPGSTSGPARLAARSTKGKVQLVPALPRALHRLNSDFALLVQRSGFPQVTLERSSDRAEGPHQLNTQNPNLNRTIQTDITHARQGARLNVLRTSPHALEREIFDPEPLAPCVAARVDVLATNPSSDCTFDPAYVAGSYAGESVVFPIRVDAVAENPELEPAWVHADPGVRYFSTWIHPHWSVFHHFSPWPVENSPVDPRLYWEPVRAQHLMHPALPLSEQSRTRNSLPTCPLMASAFTPFADGYLAGKRWVGVSRWQMRRTSMGVPVEFSLAGADRWSAEGATLAITPAGVEVTPSGTEPIRVRLEWANLTSPPFMAPATAQDVEVDWSGSGIESVRLGRVSPELIEPVWWDEGDPVTPGRFRLLKGSDAIEAGTWGLDHGAGITTDQGVDLRPEGRSLSLMADPEGAVAFPLISGRRMEALIFEITPTDPPGPILIAYPVAHRAAEVPTWLNFTGHSGAWFWPLGPGVIHGIWDWYDQGWQNPPTVNGAGFTSSVLDALATRRVLAEGVDAEVGIDAECEALYDDYEGPARGQVERNSLAFPWPNSGQNELAWALVNTAAEVPPLALWPVRARDDEGHPTGDYEQGVTVGAVEPRIYVANQPFSLHDPAGQDVLSPRQPGVPGWYVREHRLALDLNEPTQYSWRVGDEEQARLRPWHGAFGLTGAEEIPGTIVAADLHPDGRWAHAFARDETLWLGVADRRTQILAEWDTTEAAHSAAVRWLATDLESPLGLWWSHAGQILFATMNPNETPQGQIISMGTDAQFPAAWISPDGLRFVYWVEGESTGTVVAHITDRRGTVLHGPVAISSVGPVDAVGLAVAEGPRGQNGERRLRLWVVQEGVMRSYESDNGREWS